MMTRSLPFFVGVLLTVSTSNSFSEAANKADTIVIPVGSQARSNDTLPEKGLSEEAVIEQFGEPTKTFTAIGEPPIKRWQYAGFTVYFEGNVVIRSVAIHRSTTAENQ